MNPCISSRRHTAAAERIAVRVTKARKRTISQSAQRLGLTSEFMRRAALEFIQSNDTEDLSALCERVEASTREAGDALDQALSLVAESNLRIAAMAKPKVLP